MASRIGQGEFRNVYGHNCNNITAGQQDYAERMNAIENLRENYYRAAGVAPGIPTMKGSYADPEVTKVGYNVTMPSVKVPEQKPEPINPVVGGVVLGTLGKKIIEKSPVVTFFDMLCAPLKFENMFNEQMDDNVR